MTVAELGGHCCVLDAEFVVVADAIPSEIDVGQRADGVGIGAAAGVGGLLQVEDGLVHLMVVVRVKSVLRERLRPIVFVGLVLYLAGVVVIVGERAEEDCCGRPAR